MCFIRFWIRLINTTVHFVQVRLCNFVNKKRWKRITFYVLRDFGYIIMKPSPCILNFISTINWEFYKTDFVK